MDKKNTMLLTVIAIATLLVAVVGATFAFFSINASNTGISATNVTGNAVSTGAITMVTNTKDLWLKLSGADMDPAKKGTTYFATTTATGDLTSNFLTESQEHVFDLATFSLAGGDVKYDCTYDYTVTATVSGIEASAITGDLADDIKVVFAGAGITGSKIITLGELVTAGTTGVKLTGTVSELTAGTDQKITVYSSFENTETNQDALGGINYIITVTPDKDNSFSCTVVE